MAKGIGLGAGVGTVVAIGEGIEVGKIVGDREGLWVGFSVCLMYSPSESSPQQPGTGSVGVEVSSYGRQSIVIAMNSTEAKL